jgi:hypothetical protein
MEYGKADNFFFMVGAEKRGATKIFRRYRINRFELNILCCLSCYLQIHGKRIVSRKILGNWLGLSMQLEYKVNNYIFGLVKKGAVKRLAYRRIEGHSLALSPFGTHVLTEFYNEVESIDKIYKARKQMPGYQSLTVNNNLLPKGYILLDPGRDS